MYRILELLENNADLTAKELAVILNLNIDEVEAAIAQYKNCLLYTSSPWERITTSA